jgi:predicted DNA-binding transcriptional regulator AlpA
MKQIEHLQMLNTEDMIALMRISRVTLWRHIKDGTIPEPKRIGRTSLWQKIAIERWLEEEHGITGNAPKPKRRDIDELC